MRNTFLACALYACLVPASGNAFDHARTGFLLGGSTGLGAQAYSADKPNDLGSLTSAAMATSLRLGWGLDPKTELYLFNGGITSFAFYFIPIPYTSSVTGLGLRRYLGGSASRLFASAGAGVGSSSVFINMGSGSGLGLMGNVGYEYAKHWSVELEGTYANLAPVPPFDDPSRSITRATTIALKISGTAY